MTDRISSFTVVLDHDIRDDDIEPVLNAIRMVKHVIAVTPHVAEYAEVVARARRDQAWVDALLRFLRDGLPDQS